MSIRPRSASLLVVLSALLAVGVTARSHRHYGASLSVDLDEPYDRVLKVVQAVTEDGIIRGTEEYRGAGELDGAVPAKNSAAFKKAPPPGTALFKLRNETIAPEHFANPNDIGTVAVRYIVNKLGPKKTRLTIDAIFQEESHPRRHLSDGTVENAEFLAISDEIKDIEDREAKQRQDAANAVQARNLAKLQAELQDERHKLKAAQAKEQALQSKIQALNSGKQVEVRTASADLKADPYNGSKTLQLLPHGAVVTVLKQTRSWYRVQTADGARGWVYSLMLGVQ